MKFGTSIYSMVLRDNSLTFHPAPLITGQNFHLGGIVLKLMTLCFETNADMACYEANMLRFHTVLTVSKLAC